MAVFVRVHYLRSVRFTHIIFDVLFGRQKKKNHTFTNQNIHRYAQNPKKRYPFGGGPRHNHLSFFIYKNWLNDGPVIFQSNAIIIFIIICTYIRMFSTIIVDLTHGDQVRFGRPRFGWCTRRWLASPAPDKHDMWHTSHTKRAGVAALPQGPSVRVVRSDGQTPSSTARGRLSSASAAPVGSRPAEQSTKLKPFWTVGLIFW